MQIFVLGVLVFYHNVELLPPGDSFDLYIGNYELIEAIALVHAGISTINQLGWEEVGIEDKT